MLKLKISGKPVILKNAKQIAFNRRTGRRFIISSARVEAYQHKATAELCDQIHFGFEPITGSINLKMLFYGAWKEDTAIPDQSNLYQMPEDLLEAAGIIENDNLVDGHDGSKRIRMCATCDDRPIYKAGPKRGLRKPDCGAVKKCPYERIEITLDDLNA